MQRERPEVVGIVERICEFLETKGYHPEVFETRWYDICYRASYQSELTDKSIIEPVREIAGDYFGEFYWAHSQQHIYIWFKKENVTKDNNEQEQ